MIIMGIDPGTAITGYGLLKTSPLEDDGKRCPQVIDYGCIRTPSTEEMAKRLRIIYQKVSEIVHKYHPEEVAIEQVFLNKNSKTALSVGQARGVIMLAASSEGGKIFSYTPLEVKQAITGYGRAKKRQVQYMIKKLLFLPELPFPDDASDAIAVALCHYHSRKLKGLAKS
ncbi:crossover junction endodeoxyribonuclease RuvC [Candidatus Aerophobetes bacterium]|nr:crossover junction endodeoxyribonuclease RuvC [Candidatus Aerophobetes bacterium]HHJ00595.1 crossover junction endodeoxyribonuclease RuvC [Candidatus Aerophobetes bacterium]